MKKQLLLKTLLVAVCLLGGANSLWANETVWKTVKSWDFETGFAASDIEGLLPDGYWTVSETGTGSSAQVTTTIASATAVTTNSSSRYYGLLLHANATKMTLSQGGIALQGGAAYVTIPGLKAGQRVTIVIDNSDGVVSDASSTAAMESFTTTQIGSTSRYQTVGVVETGGNLVVKRAAGNTFRIKSILVERFKAERITSTLDHTAGAQWGSNGGASTVDAEKEHYNGDGATGWAGCAYAKFSYTLPAGHVITSATLNYTMVQNNNSNREDHIYYMNKDFDLDWATFAGQTGTDLRNTSYRSSSHKTQATVGQKGGGKENSLSVDVTDYVRNIAEQDQDYIIFQWTGNTGGGDLYGKDAAAAKQPTLVIETVPEAVAPILAAIDDCEANETSSAFETAIEAESFASAAEVYAFHTAWQIAQADAASSNDITKVIFDAAVSDFTRWNNARNNSGQQYTGAPDNKYFDAWNNDPSDGKQKIYGLPAGTYTIKVATRASADITDKSKYNVWVSGGSADVSVLGNHIGGEDGVLGNGWNWTILSFTLAAEADVEIGFYSRPPTDRWAGCDDWHLYKGTLSASATVGANGYTTFASTYPLDLTDANRPAGLKAYKATLDGKNLSFTKLNQTVPAGTGLLLLGETKSGSYDIPVASSVDEITTAFIGVTTATALHSVTDDTYYFVMRKAASEESPLEFAPLSTSDVTIPAGKAYITVSNSAFTDGARALDISFDDEETTGINAVNGEGLTVNGSFFDLQGRRVAQPTKGLYIVNGKKVVIK